MKERYDVAVIGGGPGGLLIVAQHGQQDLLHLADDHIAAEDVVLLVFLQNLQQQALCLLAGLEFAVVEQVGIATV